MEDGTYATVLRGLEIHADADESAIARGHRVLGGEQLLRRIVDSILAERGVNRECAIIANLRVPYHRAPRRAVLFGVIGNRPASALSRASEGRAGEVRVSPDRPAEVGGGNIHFAYRRHPIGAQRTAERIDSLDHSGRAADPDVAFAIDRDSGWPVVSDRHDAHQGAVIFQ